MFSTTKQAINWGFHSTYGNAPLGSNFAIIFEDRREWACNFWNAKCQFNAMTSCFAKWDAILCWTFKILNTLKFLFLKFNPFFTSKMCILLMLSELWCFYSFKFSFLIVVLWMKCIILLGYGNQERVGPLSSAFLLSLNSFKSINW